MWYSPSIYFDNARLLDPEQGDSLTSIRLAHGRVAGLGVKAQSGDRRFDLSGAVALPGLINAHDHL
ncbi:MAG TPA: amidohydrolase, partial [Anaerolineae bacterium]|nr:amidohydrolase [Anaerolineae bacterium]